MRTRTTPPVTPDRPSWTRHEAWWYSARTMPIGLGAVTAAIGAAWATGSGLDTTTEHLVLAVILTVPLSSIFDDDAAEMTSPSPTSLGARRAMRATIASALVVAVWAVAVWAVAVAGAATSAGRTPGSAAADVLGLVTVGSTQLAVGAVWTRRSDGALAGGLMLGFLWTVTIAPQWQSAFHPTDEHRLLWLGITAAATAVAVVGSHDPFRRVAVPAPT